MKKPFPVGPRLCLGLLVACSLLGGRATGQSPLITTFSHDNNGAVGGCLYFDMTFSSPVWFDALDVNLISPAGTNGLIEVYATPGTRVGNQTNPAVWALINSGTCTSAGPGQPTRIGLQTGNVTPGSWGFALRAYGVAFAYTNGNGSNQTYSTAEVSLSAGEASNAAFAGPLFTPRVPNLTFAYSFISGPVPPDDDCSGARPVGIGQSAAFTNAGYSSSSPLMPCGAGGIDRWFRFIAPSASLYSFNTCQAHPTNPLDTVLEVFRGSCGGLTSLGCNDDSCGYQSAVTASVAQYETIYVRVGGYLSSTGNFYLSVDPITPVTLQAGFTATPLSGAAPLSVQFTDTSTATGLPIVAWTWDFDDDGIIDSTQQNPAHVYGPGVHSVRLTVYNGSTTSTLLRPNYITAGALTANFTANTTSGPAPLSVQFTDSSTSTGAAINSWAWDFDDDGIIDSTVQYPSPFVYGAGWHSVRLTVGNGIDPPATLRRTNYITASTLTASFTASPLLAPEQTQVQCNDTSTAIGASITSWDWFVDGVHASSQHNPQFQFVAGTHTVQLTVDNGVNGPQTSAPATITATRLTAGFTASATSGQAPLTVNFTDTSVSIGAPILSHSWEIDNVVVSTAPSPSLIFGPGTHTVRLTVDNGVNPPAMHAIPITATLAPNTVVINELVYDASPSGEFVELYNSSTFAVDIGGWTLVAIEPNGSGTVQTTLATVSGATTIGAHGFHVFGSGGGTSFSHRPPDGA
ncbi:MAG: PKD domain-containing protein, partial [Planctomycetes bacterium]|nr:PKD domain-containing protein [Planctomycetota bacterium]